MINIATTKTGVKDLVSVMGSIACGKRYWKGDKNINKNNEMAPEVMTAMLLSGTKSRDKKNLNDTLENAALSISFNIDSDYLNFGTTVPKGKERLFLEIITDILMNSVFPKDEFVTVVGRMRAGILEASTDPDDVSWRAMTRTWFPEGSIQHKLSAESRLALLDKLTLQDIIECYKILVGLTEINIAVAGDVDKDLWQKEATICFAKLPKKAHKLTPQTETLNPSKNGGRKNYENIIIKDKTSANAYFATPINIDVNTQNFRALKCILRVLGGDFISRLMSEVRAKQGLTYHIGANIQGVASGDTGLVYIDASFAPSLHKKGIEATEGVLNILLNRGIKPSELYRVKNAIAGEYEVRLATSAGMASELLNCLNLGRPLTYIKDFPNLIKSVNMKEVRTVLTSLKNKPFYRVSAGSL